MTFLHQGVGFFPGFDGMGVFFEEKKDLLIALTTLPFVLSLLAGDGKRLLGIPARAFGHGDPNGELAEFPGALLVVAGRDGGGGGSVLQR